MSGANFPFQTVFNGVFTFGKFQFYFISWINYSINIIKPENKNQIQTFIPLTTADILEMNK